MELSSILMHAPGCVFTSDRLIRVDFRACLEEKYSSSIIIEELGITHGAARIDLAVLGGEIHGYELKSDIDTLDRLPEQMRIYNSVLDKVTLVVGKKHLLAAIKIIPEWWGIIIAKIVNSSEKVIFYQIREAEKNPCQDEIAIASLLWREEALKILEEINKAEGVRSKPRKIIYERLVEVLDGPTLRDSVRTHLCTRVNWRSDLQYMPSGD
jgi:hypothetical protein